MPGISLDSRAPKKKNRMLLCWVSWLAHVASNVAKSGKWPGRTDGPTHMGPSLALLDGCGTVCVVVVVVVVT